MRTRLFLSFALITAVTLLALMTLTTTSTQNVIAAFSQSGGFFGAERVVEQYAEFYAENQSWDQVGSSSSDVESSSSGNGMGQGMMGGGRGEGSGGMGGMARNEQYTLTDTEGNILQSDSLQVGETVTEQAINNALPIVVEEQVVGYLIPERSLTDLSDLISEELNAALRDSLLPTALIAAGTAILISFLFAYLLMRPVRKLTTAADQIASGKLSERVPVTSSDELGQLAVSFNEMAASLEEMQRARRAMTADIAHELRTPLAVQKANLEALQDGLYPLTQDNLIPLIEQNNLLTKLVNDLRTLTLADTGSLDVNLTPTDMSALIRQVSSGFKAEFENRGVELLASSTEDCLLVEADQQRIRQVINNLLQNSLNHTPEGGFVSIQLACENGQVSIEIRDSGEGIPPEALPHIFERFYRADGSRSRDKGGSGLGLTIAKRLVQIHNGKITAKNHPEGGAVFTISLPAISEK